jgi:hypothetical protein
MHGATCAAFRPIEKHVDPGGMSMNKSRLGERYFGTFEILAPQCQVHVLSKSHGLRIDLLDPRHDGIAANDRVGDACGVQRRGCSQKSVMDILHCSAAPFDCEQTVKLRWESGIRRG